MLIDAYIEEKHMGSKLLMKDVAFQVQEGEAIGLVGRNGAGKSTLARLLMEVDQEYIGSVRAKKGLIVLTTEQEQHGVDESLSTLNYVLAGLRDYTRLTELIESAPETMGEDMAKIEAYTNALEQYEELGYYYVRDRVVEALKAYQLSEEQITGPFRQLSGGQKRFAQLVQIEYSQADLLILDEPTNHMDYVAKANFCEWLKSTTSAVIVITHDRDVLAEVDRIVELKDLKLHVYPGNYDAYLKQNATSNVAAMHQYEVDVKTLENRREALRQAQIKKSKSKSSPNPFVPLVRRIEKEVAELEERISRPTIWIDQASIADLKRGQTEQYGKYKAKNISVKPEGQTGHASLLMSGHDLALGFDQPLFSGLSFELRASERTHIIGRNGAGKTTLVEALCAAAAGQASSATVYAGIIECSPSLVIGRYEQEIDPGLLDKTLAEAIADIFKASGRPVNDEAIYAILSEYLFEPTDREVPVNQLSGGQKARIQLIALFANRPNLLVLDEPTNHLDLPSIEELERALDRFHGAIIYVSHDSYFAKTLGGTELQIGSR